MNVTLEEPPASETVAEADGRRRTAPPGPGGGPQAGPPTPPRRRARGAANRLLELGLAIALCLAFFAVIVGLLSRVFPSGISLHELMNASEKPRTPAGGPARQGMDGLEASVPLVARLEVLAPDVRTRHAEQISWQEVKRSRTLQDRDGVQTSDRGDALVRFDGGGQLRLGGNTLIIIRQPRQSVFTRERLGEVLVVSGELQIDLPAGADAATRFDMVLASGQSRVACEGGDQGQVSLRIKVDESGQASVAVYQGEAAIESDEGRVRLGANEFATVDEQGRATSPQTLPPAPSALAPPDAAAYVYRNGAPEVVFAWTGGAATDRYHLTVARDPNFHHVVIDELLAEETLSCNTLQAGSYHWRVSVLRGGLEGPLSPRRALRIASDTAGPFLDVALPPAVVDAASFALTGVTESDVQIFVGEEPVPVGADGRFHHDLSLSQGVNVVVVRAIDEAGNISYRSAVVVARYQGRP